MNWLEGQNIRLRAVEPEDLELLLSWENDTDNWEVSGTLAPFSRNLMKRYIENTHLNIYQTGQYRFIVELISSGESIGTADIFDFDPFHKRAGIGILIGTKDQRGRGFATEAIDLLKSYCFEHLELHQLFCNILSDNEISLKLFKNAGFEISGTKKEWIKTNGGYKDELFLQLSN